MVSPVNWVYSVRNALDDWGAPRVVVEWFSLESPVPLAAVHRRSTGCTSARAAPRCSARCSGASPTADDHPPGVSGPEINTAPVVVLGGGIAGLTATRELLRNGIDAVLYEAARRSAGWPTATSTPTASPSTPARTSSPTGSPPRPA